MLYVHAYMCHSVHVTVRRHLMGIGPLPTMWAQVQRMGHTWQDLREVWGSPPSEDDSGLFFFSFGYCQNLTAL